VSDDVLALLRRDWQRHLRNLNRAANTQRIYDTVARQFREWLAEHDRPLDPREIGKRKIPVAGHGVLWAWETDERLLGVQRRFQ
jgi:hypothetical protein